MHAFVSNLRRKISMSHFYYATRMHSVDSVVARCLSVCPFVCLSHAGIESKRLYISSNFFSPSGSPTILVFPYQTGWQYSDGDPPNGASNARGYEKITIFDQYRPLSAPLAHANQLPFPRL